MRTLKQIVTAAVDELGSISVPSTIIGSSDDAIRQLLALANREGYELSSRGGNYGGWPILRKEHTITTIANTPNYAFPSDLQYFMNTTAWDRTNKWPLRGPISPQEWQILKSGTIGSVGPRRRFRLMEGEIYFDPTPENSNETYVIEYYSNAWCQSETGDPQSEWLANTDVPILPDECFITGLQYRFKEKKGLDFASEYRAYEATVSREIARAGMAKVADLTGEPVGERFLDDLNIPDTGYGSV